MVDRPERDARAQRLSWGSDHAREMLEGAQIGMLFIDKHMRVRGYTAEIAKLFDVSGGHGSPVTQFAQGFDGLELSEQIADALAERRPVGCVASRRGTNDFYLVRVLPYRIAEEDTDGVVITLIEVTSMILAERQQRTLVTELNHRVRNMLQLVIGLCNQIVHRSSDLKQFQAAFMGRVQGLARAYDLLSREAWQSIQIADLVRTQLAAFAHSQRYTLQGGPFTLTADAALALGLALYELAANATKHGALSNDAGHIAVSWDLEPIARPEQDGAQELVIRWRENAGPTVVAPSRQGFGSELIERQLRYTLNGRASLAFLDSGVEVTLRVPAKDIVRAAPT